MAAASIGQQADQCDRCHRQVTSLSCIMQFTDAVWLSLGIHHLGLL